jgi:hypothetical protein
MTREGERQIAATKKIAIRSRQCKRKGLEKVLFGLQKREEEEWKKLLVIWVTGGLLD